MYFQQKTKKTQINQKQLLTEFVIKNFNDLYDANTSKGQNLSLEQTRAIRAERNVKWNRIIVKLNSIGPPKNLMQWKKCYSDIARHIRTKNNNLNSFRLGNPNCEIPAHLQLTENEIKVLSLHGVPLKTHRNKFYDYEETSIVNDPFTETKDSINDETSDDFNHNNDDSDEGDNNNFTHPKRKNVSVEENSNDLEPNFEGFPEMSDEKDFGEIPIVNNNKTKKQKISWKLKAKESIELQKNSLRNLIDIRKEMKNKKSCESCCESNKLIISMQKDNLTVQKMILDEQRKCNILQAKNLEIQLKILAELKGYKSNLD